MSNAVTLSSIREKALYIRDKVESIDKIAGQDDALFRQMIMEFFFPNDVKKKLTW